MKIKNKSILFTAIVTFIFTALLSCGIFAAVSKSVSFNLALVTKPNVYFALTITHVNGNAVGADANKTGFLIFDNRATNAGSVVSWATVNQNCIVLNQVMAGANMPDITPGTTITLKVTNYTNEAGKYLHLGLNYLPIQYQDFTMNNGYGVANLAYNASESFTITTQNILANTYVQIPFLAEIDAERFTATINTNQYATMVRNSGTIKAGENYTAEFTSTQEKPYYFYEVTVFEETLVEGVATTVEHEYTYTNRTGVLELPADILLGNITINANSITEWNGEKLAPDKNATFSGGTGIEPDPYLIGNALDYVQLAQNSWNGRMLYRDTYFKMSNDIILNENYEEYESWTTETQGLKVFPQESIRDFYGVFDGNNKTVYGLFQPAGYGFMWRNNNIVKNLTMSHGFVCAGWSTSGIVVDNMAGATIENCKNYMNITYSGTNSESRLSGICNYNCGKINNCHNYGKITGNNYVGGVVSLNLLNNTSCYALIINCSNHGEVYGVGSSVGGIAAVTYHSSGWNNCTHGGVIVNCYNTGSVSGARNVGGIAGYQKYLITTNCYNTGLVTRISGSDTRIGGIAGEFVAGALKNCYYKSGGVVDANGNAIGNDLEGTTVMTDSDMKSSTFANTLTTNATALETIYDYLGGLLVYSTDCKSWTTGTDGYPTFA